MAMSILNNITALTAENNLSITQANLQKTLTQLSSGSKINSGSDDAAGLSIANGLTASITALTQSGQNATNGTGVLQTADGALSEVTTLLNRAVTLATEASNSGLTSAQATALNNEFTSIQNEITNIGKTTTFNGSTVFGSSTDANTVVSNDASMGGSDTFNSGTLSVKVGGSSYTFTPATGDTLGGATNSLTAKINAQTGTTGIQASVNSSGQLALKDILGRGNIAVTSSTLNYGTGGADVLTSAGSITGGTYEAKIASTEGADTSVDVTVGNQTTDFAVTANTTYAQLVTAINNANIGVTAAIGGSDSAPGALSLTDNQNRGDLGVAVTGAAADVAKVLTAIGGIPEAATTGGAAMSQFTNAQLQDMNTVQSSTGTNVSPGTTFGSTVTTGQLVVTAGTNKYVFTATANETVGQLINNINSSGDGLKASINSSTGAFDLTDTSGNGNIAVNVAASDAVVTDALGLSSTNSTTSVTSATYTNPAVSASNTLSVFLSDSTGQGTSTVTVGLNQLDSAHLGGSTGIATNDLMSTTDAQAALTAINNAISNVAAFRGNIGAGVNQLAAASTVMTNEVTNLTSAESGITDADIGTTVANMSKDTTLQQTGIAALQQANQASQAVLKLLQ